MSSYLCTICLSDPDLLTPSKLEKIVHLSIFTNKNNGIVQDNSHGHATLKKSERSVEYGGEKNKNNSREEKRSKVVPRIKPHSPSSSWCKIFIFRVYDRHNGTILKSFFFS